MLYSMHRNAVANVMQLKKKNVTNLNRTHQKLIHLNVDDGSGQVKARARARAHWILNPPKMALGTNALCVIQDLSLMLKIHSFVNVCVAQNTTKRLGKLFCCLTGVYPTKF